MRRTALAIMLAGFAFTFFSIPAAGIDLLIDAVGFLLVFNSLRPLKKLWPAFGPSPWVCLFLVAVSALQLFFTGEVSLVLTVLRAAGECLLFVFLARGLFAMARVTAHARLAPAVAACAALNAVGAAFSGLLPFMAVPAAIAGAVLLACHVALLGALLALALASGHKN